MENLDKVKIMLIDDDKDYLSITKMYLKAKGLNIIGYSNPEEAIKFLETNEMDIVLLDYFMPEMTGKEFVERLRKFNSQTLVILQTGFAEEKPPVEMLTELNIQGYHDKSKGVEDLLLLSLSAVKTVNLMKQNQEQKMEICRLNYKDEFIGSLIVGVINDSKSQLMSISAATMSIQDTTDQFKDEVNIITHAHENLANIFEALNFEYLEAGVTISQVIKTVKQLLKFKMNRDMINLNIVADIENKVLDCKANTLIYVLIEIIKYLGEAGNNNINIEFKSSHDVVTVNLPKFNYEMNFIKKIDGLISQNDKIEIVNDNEFKIVIH